MKGFVWTLIGALLLCISEVGFESEAGTEILIADETGRNHKVFI